MMSCVRWKAMIDVTCAIIRNEDDEVLVVQRDDRGDHPFRWEFPGGKKNHNETEEECIIREIREELAISIIIRRRMEDVQYDYGNKKVRLIPFICDTLDDFPLLSEHVDFKWLNPVCLREVDFCEADLIVADAYFKDLELPAENNDRESFSVVHQSYNEDDLRAMIGSLMGIKEAEWIAESASENNEILRKLLEYSFSEDRKLAFRASWTLSKVYDKDPDIIYPFFDSLVDNLEKLDNESVQRSFLRIISLSDIGKISIRQHGILAEHAFKMLRSGTSAIAIKAYSMEIIYKLVHIYPELANELTATINVLQGEGSAGIVARGHIILKKLAGSCGDSQSSPK